MSSWLDQRMIGSYELRGHRVDAYLGSSWKARRGPQGPWVRVRQIGTAFLQDPAVYDALCEGAFWEMELAQPSIMQAIDLVADGGTLGMVSEFVPGKDLRAVIEIARQANIAVPHGVLLRIVDDLLDGLIALDETARATQEVGSLAGGLHPDCVHVGADGRARLTDVTASAILSRCPGIDRAPLRAVYRAPEHWTGAAADECSDVFVLGSLMWEALARRRLQTTDPLGPSSVRIPLPINQCIPLGGEPIPSAFADVVTLALEPERPQRCGGYVALREALAHSGIEAASRSEVAAFMQALQGTGSRAEPAVEAPSTSDHAFASEERTTGETLNLRLDTLQLPNPTTEVVALVHVLDSSQAPPPVVVTNQPPRDRARLRRRVRVGLVAASVIAVATALVLLTQGSPAGADRREQAAASAAALEAPSTAPSEALPVVTPRPVQPVGVSAPAPALAPAPTPAANAASDEQGSATPAVKSRPASTRRPPKPHPFTPDDI